MKLIVVEDEKIIRTGLLKHVPWQRLGVSEVEAAANGEEALAKTENFRPDIVLSDIRMPGMSGVDLCRKLREKFPEIELLYRAAFRREEREPMDTLLEADGPYDFIACYDGAVLCGF